MSEKTDYSKLTVENLKELIEQRGLSAPSDAKKDDLVALLQDNENQDIAVEYVGPGNESCDVLVPYMQGDPVLATGKVYEVPKDVADSLLLNANFRPLDRTGEKIRAKHARESREGALGAASALTAARQFYETEDEHLGRVGLRERTPEEMAGATGRPVEEFQSTGAAKLPEGGNA